MESKIYVCSIIWLYLGMYGYIYWVNRANRARSVRRWRPSDVFLIPIMGVLGIFTYIAGRIIYNKQK